MTMDCGRFRWFLGHLVVACAVSMVSSRITLFHGHGNVDTIKVRFIGHPAAEGRMVPCSASLPTIPKHAHMYVAMDMWEDGFACGTCHVLTHTRSGPVLTHVAGVCQDCPRGSIAMAGRYLAPSLPIEGTLTRTRCPLTLDDGVLHVVDQGPFATIDFAPLGGEAGNIVDVKVLSENGWNHLLHAYGAMFELYGHSADESIVLSVMDGFKGERVYTCSRRALDLSCIRKAQSDTGRKPLSSRPNPPPNFSVKVPIPMGSTVPLHSIHFRVDTS